MSFLKLSESQSENVLIEDDQLPAWELIAVSQAGERLPVIRVNEKPLVIGRKPDCDIVLSDPTVSQNHAEVLTAGPMLFLHDRGSTNGTFVNGIKVRERTQLGDGDQIVIGTFVLQVHVQQFDTVKSSHRGVATVVSLDHWLKNTLEELVQGKDLFTAFQPIQSLKTGKVLGFEALVRSRIIGLETPEELFRLVTKFQRARQLSETCRVMAATEARSLPASTEVFLNTSSAESLDGELLDSLQKVRELQPNLRFVIEIHEDCLTDATQLGPFQERLDDLNMGLAFDDFGVGKSRLQDLLHVRPDYVKFDKALLLESLLFEKQQQAWVRSLVQSVHDLGIKTIAEGVESDEVLNLCKKLGFDLCQGYVIGRPAPVSHWRSPNS